MTTFTFPQRFAIRGDTALALFSRNEVLREREQCVETDTGRFKVGDGQTPWNDLLYAGVGFASDLSTITNGQVLGYNSTTGRWDPTSLPVPPATTDALTEGSTNKYFTDERAQDAINALISAGIHTNITFSYNDAGNALSATVTGGGAGSMSLLDAVAVTGSAATVLTSGTVSLSSYKEFLVLFSLKNNTASSANISLYFNGDTTAANYARQSVTFTATTFGSSRASDAIMDALPASENLVGRITIENDLDGRPRAIALGSRDNAANIACRFHSQRWSSASNITSITLSSSVANTLAIGSKMYIFGIN